MEMDTGDQAFYENYYSNQSGGAFYSGRSYIPRQQGQGIGNFLRSAGRYITPLLVKGGKTIGRQLLNTGVGIVEDLIDGRNIRDSAKEHFSNVGEALFSKIKSSKTKPPSFPKRNRKRKRVVAKRGGGGGGKRARSNDTNIFG